MKKDRTIKELLELLLENQHLFDSGLCIWAFELSTECQISIQEENMLYMYIKNNRPINLRYFKGYYWPIGNIKPRIEWIKEHIKKNS